MSAIPSKNQTTPKSALVHNGVRAQPGGIMMGSTRVDTNLGATLALQNVRAVCIYICVCFVVYLFQSFYCWFISNVFIHIFFRYPHLV